MADDMNVVGDLSGGDARKKQLEQIRTSAKEAGQEINALSGEFKELSKLAGANKNIGMDIGKVKALTKSMSEMTVSTLKSSRERKKFSTQILAAEKEQAGTTATIKNLVNEIKLRKAEEFQLEQAADAARRKSRDEQASFSEKITAATATAIKLEQDAETLLSAAKVSGDKTELANANKAHASMMAKSKAQFSIEKKLTAQAAEKEAVMQKQINAKEDLVREAQVESSTLQAQKTLADEINGAQEKQLTAAKQLESEMKKVDAAGNGILKSFSKFGEKIGGMIPVFGSMFQTVFGELGKSQQMFEDAVAQGTSKAGARFTALTGTIKALSMAALTSFAKLAFDGAKISSEAFKTVRKGLGGGLIDASIAMKSASGAASAMGIPLQEAAGFIGQMNDALG